MSASRLREAIRQLRAQGDTETLSFIDPDSATVWPIIVEDENIGARIDGREFAAQKAAALRAHRTQIEPDGDFFKMNDIFGEDAMGWEFYRLVKGDKGPVGEDGFEEDLFAGL